MAMVKLNVFHWHMTDSQSFPLVLKSHPDLSEIGAYSPDKIYTIKDIIDVRIRLLFFKEIIFFKQKIKKNPYFSDL